MNLFTSTFNENDTQVNKNCKHMTSKNLNT